MQSIAPISIDLLQAVSDWMRDRPRDERPEIAMRIKAQAALLHISHRTASQSLYRQLVLNSENLLDAGLRYKLDEQVSCWTLSEAVARNLKGGVHSDTRYRMTVIFRIEPDQSGVILNLDSLLSDSEFQKAVEQNRNHIRHFASGLGRWVGEENQHEVIYETASLPLDAVFAFGGFYRNQESMTALWKGLSFDQDLAFKRIGVTGIIPGSEHWLTAPDVVSRLVAKWIYHANKRA
jgi:hypothetical protein